MMTQRLISLSMITKSLISIVSTWFGVYPLLTALAILLEPVLDEQSIFIRTFVMSAIMVPLMVIVIMPAINHLVNNHFFMKQSTTHIEKLNKTNK
jgi:antibiotic biosynthesis monooxygenase (ABM) superfamily enzyme